MATFEYLPSLASLCIDDDGDDTAAAAPAANAVGPHSAPFRPRLRQIRAHMSWIRACGGWPNVPSFKKWRSLNGESKSQFYDIVNLSENDKFSNGQYNCPYSGMDIDKLLKRGIFSIEHVVPRSLINASAPGVGENDPFGWEPETRHMNSKRSNLPLVLWPTPAEIPVVGRVRIDGDVEHFNPLEGHKARLARRWMYVRATYGLYETIEPPTDAQKQNADAIIEMVKTTSAGYAEARMARLTTRYVHETYHSTWTNPLYEKDAALQFLNDDDWKCFVFQLDGSRGRRR